ncbi:hypothetical protein [Alienimonas sp. DA493]|uniref:hypothetical protein n=1 Tax=Alienimonas sp. DA493 TaxID=3373605 RepID=UPI003754008D
MLRAPHDAAGALGDCPHCEKEIRIPGGAVAEADDPLGFIPVGAPLDQEAVEAAVQQSAPERRVDVPEPAPAAAAAGGGVTFEAADDEAAPVTFESADDEPAAANTANAAVGPAAVAKPVRSRRGRRRGKRGNPVLAGLVLLVLFGGIGGAGWVMYERLAGGGATAVSAELVAAEAAPPAYFLPPDPVSQQALRTVESGVPFVSPILEVRLNGVGGSAGGAGTPAADAGGMVDRATSNDEPPDGGNAPAADAPADLPNEAILVTVRPGDAGRLVRVAALRERPEVKAWLEANPQLYGEKQVAFTKARVAFFSTVADGGDASPFRDSVALNAATDVTGWSVEVLADGRVLPCCRETDSGDLYFCLPRTATAFTIRGRNIPGVGPTFPFTYVAAVEPPPGG